MTETPRPLNARSRGFPALLRAMRSTIRADSDPNRQALFTTFKDGNFAARLIARTYGALGPGWPSTILVSGYGLGTFLSSSVVGGDRPLLLTIAVHANAQRQVKRVAGWFPAEPISTASFTARNALSLGGIGRIASLGLHPGRVARALGIIHKVNARGNFLLSCRVAAVLASYVRARSMIARYQPGAIVVSSDTNPEELGFSAAARAIGCPTVYIAHAYPPPYVPALDHSLALLEGEASRDARLRRGNGGGGRVFLLGFEGSSQPMDTSRLWRTNPVVGVLAPKNVSWATLAQAVVDLRDHIGVGTILIRWHPSMLESPRLRDFLADWRGVQEASRTDSLHDVVARCDWAVSDPNSNVHLQVLKTGVPTIALSGLAILVPGREDPYGFQSNQVVLAVRRIADLRLPDANAFYGGNWPARFARYDAAYLCDPLELERSAAAMIRRTIALSTP